jgi:hypothetical protein
MQRSILFAAVFTLIVGCGSAMAQDAACASKAIGKDGRPLAGAAKTSFLNKCCEDSAVGKDGKPLSGAAKTSFVKKCTSG